MRKFLFSKGGEKNQIQISSVNEFHTEMVCSFPPPLSGCLCPGEMRSVLFILTALRLLLRPWQRANEGFCSENSCSSSPSRKVQASAYSAAIKGPPIKANTTSLGGCERECVVVGRGNGMAVGVCVCVGGSRWSYMSWNEASTPANPLSMCKSIIWAIMSLYAYLSNQVNY